MSATSGRLIAGGDSVWRGLVLKQNCRLLPSSRERRCHSSYDVVGKCTKSGRLLAREYVWRLVKGQPNTEKSWPAEWIREGQLLYSRNFGQLCGEVRANYRTC